MRLPGFNMFPEIVSGYLPFVVKISHKSAQATSAAAIDSIVLNVEHVLGGQNEYF